MTTREEQLKRLLLLYFPATDVVTIQELLRDIEVIYEQELDITLETRRKAFIDNLQPYLELYGKQMMNKFGAYWLERSPKGKQFRFEKEKTFDVALRLKTWAKRSQAYSITNLLKKQTVNPLK